MANAPATTPTQPQATLLQPSETCPMPNQLAVNNLVWKGPGCWADDTESFVRQISAFVEAQWSGSNKGAIYCKYEGKDKSQFYVVLQCRGKLANKPEGGKWNTTKHWNTGGSSDMICKSANPADCPFIMDVPKAPKDIYEEISKIKTSAHTHQNQLYW